MTKKLGRPRIDQEAAMDVYPVRITAWHARKARRIGDQNLSEGVRRALEKYPEEQKTNIAKSDST